VQYWTATPQLFARAGKATTLKVLAEQLGLDVANNVAKLKKAELAKVAADRLYGTGWLPPAMLVVNRAKLGQGDTTELAIKLHDAEVAEGVDGDDTNVGDQTAMANAA
jgi:hypothetical protein